MPGRNPHEAVRNFIDPLSRAIGVLDGYAVLYLSKRGGYHQGEELAWVLNEGEGMELPGVGMYFAEMGFKVVPADPAKHEGKFRVTTLRYRYKLRDPNGEDLWRVHWHPDGTSSYKDPHIHIRPQLKVHLPTPRITFEQTIQWCIGLGAPLSCSAQEARDKLAESEFAHTLYRSWSTKPPTTAST